MTMKKSINYIFFVLCLFPLLLIALSVFRSGNLDLSVINNETINSIAFTPFSSVIIDMLNVFNVTASGYLLLIVNYFSYLIFILLVYLVFKLVSWLLTLFSDFKW